MRKREPSAVCDCARETAVQVKQDGMVVLTVAVRARTCSLLPQRLMRSGKGERQRVHSATIRNFYNYTGLGADWVRRFRLRGSRAPTRTTGQRAAATVASVEPFRAAPRPGRAVRVWFAVAAPSHPGPHRRTVVCLIIRPYHPY